MKHPAAEQVEPGAAVHGALDRLQPADLALDRTRRPRRLERGPDGREVLLEALGEAPERRPGRGREPPVQRPRPLLPDERGEAPGEVADLRQSGRLGQQPLEERAVRAGPRARSARPGPDSPPGSAWMRRSTRAIECGLRASAAAAGCGSSASDEV